MSCAYVSEIEVLITVENKIRSTTWIYNVNYL